MLISTTKIIVILFVISIETYAQSVGYISIDNKVYNFLERMCSLHFIDGYDTFELPKTRKEISTHLKQLSKEKLSLPLSDRKLLEKYLFEFQYEIFSSTQNYSSLITEQNVNNLFSEKKSFLYYSVDSVKNSVFVNFQGGADNIRFLQNGKSLNTTIFRFGGSVSGTVIENVGYYLHATNGSYIGNKRVVLLQDDLRYNFKFNSSQATSTGDEFFDETEGYILADFNYLRLKIGRDRQLIGDGYIKSLLSDKAPQFNYISLQMNYDLFNFSFFHGSLLGNVSSEYDSLQGSIRTVTEKFMAYHRLGLNLGQHSTLGVGEIIIYSRRAIDLDYLNPFAFYTSIQHSEQDRDNAMLFFDFKNNSVKGLKIFGMFLIDDMDFGKIGTSWYGNKTLFSLGLYSSLFNAFCPLDFSLQFIRVEPYTFTHRIRGNEYSNLGYNLIEPIIPNSQIFNAAVFYRFSSNLDIVLSYLNIVHGDNEKDPNGNLSVNHGGDILIGHRPFDSINAKFLGGNKHYLSSYNFNLFYQPTLNYRFNFTMNLKYNKSSYEPRNMELQTNFGFDVIL